MGESILLGGTFLMKVNVAYILKKHKELWKKANDLNPALKEAGSNLSWSNYYKAKELARAFEKEIVEIKGGRF